MAVSNTIFKIYLTAAKKRFADGESIEDILDSMNKLSDEQKTQLTELLMTESEAE